MRDNYVEDAIGTADRALKCESRLTKEMFESDQGNYGTFTFVSTDVKNVGDQYVIQLKAYAENLQELTLNCTLSEFRARRHDIVCIGHNSTD